MSNETFKFRFEADLGDMNDALTDGSNATEILERKITKLERELLKLDKNSAKTEKEIEDLNREMKLGALNTEEYDRELEALTNTQKRLSKETSRTQANINRYRGSLARLSPAYRAQTINAGKALPVVQEFSRIIQDAPFGIIGVGNNLTQLGDNFSVLARRAGGATAALRIVGGALLGPAGLLVLFSGLITALTLSSSRFRKTGDEGEKAFKKISDSLDDLLEPLERLRKISELREDILELQGEATLKQIKATNALLQLELESVNAELAKEESKLRQAKLDKDAVTNMQALAQAAKDLFQVAIGGALLLGDLTFDALIDSTVFGDLEKLGDLVDKALVIDKSKVEQSKDALKDYQNALAAVAAAQTRRLKILKDLNIEQNKANQIIGAGLLEIGASLASVFGSTEVIQGLQNIAINFVKIAEVIKGEAQSLGSSVASSFTNLGQEVSKGLQGSLNFLVGFIGKATETMRRLKDITDNTAKEIQLILAAGFAPAISEFGDILGRELSRGASFVEAAGAGFVGALTTIISAIADELIKMGTLAVAIGGVQQTLDSITPGASKIAVGLAAIAVGTSLKAISSAARGSVVNGGGGGSFSSSGAGSFAGGGGGSFSGSISGSGGGNFAGGEVVFEIAGQKLVGVLNRTLKGKGKTASDII